VGRDRKCVDQLSREPGELIKLNDQAGESKRAADIAEGALSAKASSIPALLDAERVQLQLKTTWRKVEGDVFVSVVTILQSASAAVATDSSSGNGNRSGRRAGRFVDSHHGDKTRSPSTCGQVVFSLQLHALRVQAIAGNR